MLEAIGTGVTSAVEFCGEVLTSITTGNMAVVLPVIGLSIGMGVVGFAIAKIKSLVWGM